MPRKEEFLPDGHRIIVPALEVVQLWRHHSSLDPRYALATTEHESSRTTNEKDTEVTGFISMGMYQVSQEEMTHVGMADANIYDPEECTIVFAALTQERYNSIRNAVPRLFFDGPNLLTPRDLNAYLFIAHNQGLAACLKTLRLHGMDWSGYKSRNEAAAQAALNAAKATNDPGQIAQAQAKLKWWLDVFSYGNDCLTGGPSWNDSFLQAVA